MSKRQLLFSMIGVLVLGAGGFGLWLLRPDPTGLATGTTDPAERAAHRALWDEMKPCSPVFLQAYASTFEDPPDDPMLLVTAFNELAYSVTGRAGIWRKLVPDRYFGCAAGPDEPICQKIREAEPEFVAWDRIQDAAAALDTDRDARRFLRQNGAKIREYLKTYVPRDRSLTAIQDTPFFAQHLASALKGDSVGSR